MFCHINGVGTQLSQNFPFQTAFSNMTKFPKKIQNALFWGLHLPKYKQK